jgi:glycosyltransferase involved in cell wall biosynthesis
VDAAGRFILAVGRLSEEKGFDCLMRAFSLVRAEHPGLNLVILGEGRDRAKLESLRAELELNDCVLMPGHRAAAAWLQKASVFVLASRYEGFPNALAEAMAAGLPIVATRCRSGPEEMLEDGRDGFLVAVDDEQAMSERIKRLLGSQELRCAMGERARQVANTRFTPELIWAEWEKVIRSAIANRAVRRGA